MSFEPDHPYSMQVKTTEALPGVTSIDEPWKSVAFKMFIAFVLLEPVVIIGVLLATGAPTGVIVIVAAAALIVPVLAIWIVGRLWNVLARRYPQQPVIDGAVSKSWQSFGFGPIMRFNNCLTIIADERHVHVLPMSLLRIFGARIASLPLDQMRDLKPALGGGMVRAMIDGRTICGPAWCMNLAAPLNDDDQHEQAPLG